MERGRDEGQTAMSGDDVTLKQFPYDLKAEATASGYRIHGHVYGDAMDQVVIDLASMISKAVTQFEKESLPLAVNASRVAK